MSSNAFKYDRGEHQQVLDLDRLDTIDQLVTDPVFARRMFDPTESQVPKATATTKPPPALVPAPTGPRARVNGVLLSEQESARLGLLTIVMPSPAKTASNDLVNLVSRSRMRNFTAFPWSSRSMEKLRA